jgi:hypothetical protein
MRRHWRWLAAIVVLLAAVGVVRGCATGGGTDAAVAPTRAQEARSGRAPDATASGSGIAARELEARRAAYRSAISTLQRYLAALGDDVARADAYWAGGTPPAASGEADLRSLRDLRALRIENRMPVPLDTDAVPGAVEIQVELRVGLKDVPMRRYQGWYRLRRAIDGERWEITSASIDASPPGR